MNTKLFVLTGTIVFVLIAVIVYLQSQNNSVDQKVIQNSSKTVEVQEVEVQAGSPIQEIPEQPDPSETMVNKETITLPQTYSVVAEEILYPDEYDFGIILNSTVMAAVGKPIKIDTLPIAMAKVGDTIELEFDGKRFKSEVFEVEEQHFEAELGDDAEGIMTYVQFDSRLDADIESTRKNQISGGVTYDKNGVVRGTIRIQDKGGDYVINIHKQVAYYALTQEWQAEFAKQGYMYD